MSYPTCPTHNFLALFTHLIVIWQEFLLLTQTPLLSKKEVREKGALFEFHAFKWSKHPRKKKAPSSLFMDTIYSFSFWSKVKKQKSKVVHSVVIQMEKEHDPLLCSTLFKYLKVNSRVFWVIVIQASAYACKCRHWMIQFPLSFNNARIISSLRFL